MGLSRYSSDEDKSRPFQNDFKNVALGEGNGAESNIAE